MSFAAALSPQAREHHETQDRSGIPGQDRTRRIKVLRGTMEAIVERLDGEHEGMTADILLLALNGLAATE